VVTTSSIIKTLVPGEIANPRPQLERARRPLEKHCVESERAAHFMPGDYAAHCGRNDGTELILYFIGNAAGQFIGQHCTARRIHKDARALQVTRASEPRGQDEMSFQQRIGGPKFGQYLFVSHRMRSAHVAPAQ
jgi:hypothetical protein